MATAPPGPSLVRQPSLLAMGTPRRRRHRVGERIDLGRGAWLDWSPGWLEGADDLFEWCAHELTWTGGERPMYDRMVAEPRLTATVDLADHPSSILASLADELSVAYGRPLAHIFANFYRNGRDSVAWHADRIGRVERQPTIPLLSLGGPRTFALRPFGGGSARSFELHSGDLLVMGGACQQAFEHSVPKRAQAHPRISLTFRHRRDGRRDR